MEEEIKNTHSSQDKYGGQVHIKNQSSVNLKRQSTGSHVPNNLTSAANQQVVIKSGSAQVKNSTYRNVDSHTPLKERNLFKNSA